MSVPLPGTLKGHREDIISEFVSEFRNKYDRGQQEHGGKLWEDPNLLGKAIEETQDLVAYLYTLRQQGPKPAVYGFPHFDEVYRAVGAECDRIVLKKRPLSEHSAATRLAVLVEEVGEVAKALLPSDSDQPLYDELKQVAAFAMCWMAFLRSTGAR